MVSNSNPVVDFIKTGIHELPLKAREDGFWKSLRDTGTLIWLDTGDMDEAEANWTAEMSALTTNNTLLNNEIQKGIYDRFIEEAGRFVKGLPREEKVREIAFMLNARHGLRLAARFGVNVSVELHTCTADDIDAIVSYGKRYHAIDPVHFIVKVPYTASGLLGARKLRDAGIRINFTLEFSARENVIVTSVARPDFLNVFLGRVGAYMVNNKLGDGSGAGEMAVLSSQKWVSELSTRNPWVTRLIAASLRNHEQLELLAGTDVYTIPPKVAASGRKTLEGNFVNNRTREYPVSIFPGASGTGIEKFWSVDDKVLRAAASLSEKVPADADELTDRMRNAGLPDMFPVLDDNEIRNIAGDGKIPVFSRWEKRLRDGSIGPDTLLTLAGLASFTADQAMLDNRIRDIAG
ncbi:MAG: transaldolase family protein [Bacteroidales bacterium]